MSDWRTKAIIANKKQKTKKSQRARWTTFGKWVLGALILLGIFYSLNFLLPRVEITVIPESRLVSFSGLIPLEEKAELDEDIRPDRQALPVKRVTTAGESDNIFSSTGEKNIGQVAQGSVVFKNFTGLSQTVLPEDGLETSDGKHFTIPVAVLVPAASVSAEGEIAPGQVDSKVLALSPGDDHNIQPQKLFILSVSPDKQLKIFAEAPQALTGGTSEVVKVISAEDLATAQESLRQELKARLLEEISGDLPDGQAALSETFSLDEEEFASEVHPEQETEEFNYFLRAKGSVLIYETDQVHQIIKFVLGSQLSPEEVFLDTEPVSFSVEKYELNVQKQGIIETKATWLVSQPVPTDDFAEQILGLQEADARRIILGSPGVADVIFNWSLAINKRIPNVPSHILIKLGSG